MSIKASVFYTCDFAGCASQSTTAIVHGVSTGTALPPPRLPSDWQIIMMGSVGQVTLCPAHTVAVRLKAVQDFTPPS
jgi:hypothetical protein